MSNQKSPADRVRETLAESSLYEDGKMAGILLAAQHVDLLAKKLREEEAVHAAILCEQISRLLRSKAVRGQ